MSVLIVGSIALDTVKTPVEEHADLLGGSASYSAVGASFFTQTNLVGIVGDDFPKAHIDFLQSRNIDLAGLQIVRGKTFRWSGEYEFTLDHVLADMIVRCRELRLRAVGGERQLLENFAVLLTVKTMHYLYTPRDWIAL